MLLSRNKRQFDILYSFWPIDNYIEQNETLKLIDIQRKLKG